jgi:hypothetical protein
MTVDAANCAFAAPFQPVFRLFNTPIFDRFSR